MENELAPPAAGVASILTEEARPVLGSAHHNAVLGHTGPGLGTISGIFAPGSSVELRDHDLAVPSANAGWDASGITDEARAAIGSAHHNTASGSIAPNLGTIAGICAPGTFRNSRFKLLGRPRRVLRGDDSTGSDESLEAAENQQKQNDLQAENQQKQSELLAEIRHDQVEVVESRQQSEVAVNQLVQVAKNQEVHVVNHHQVVVAENQQIQVSESKQFQQIESKQGGGASKLLNGFSGVKEELHSLRSQQQEVKVAEGANVHDKVVTESKESDSSRGKTRENANFVWVNNKRYQKLGKIGSGGSSHVFKVIAQDCTIYALKRIILKGRDHQTACGFHQEIEYLERLKGKNHIIQLIDYEVTDKTIFRSDSAAAHGEILNDVRIYMVLEYGEIDLARILERKKSEDGQLDENWLRLHWEHILKAVNTIHEERIVHADLKPANFLLVQGALKLIDFGIAKAIQNDTTNIVRESQVGTLNYMSPEAFLMNSRDEQGTVKCGRASDIWSLGCILYQMVYGRTPFSHLSFYQKIREITNENHVINFPPVSNPLIVDVMKSCLMWDKDKRPRIPQLLEHAFLKPRPPPPPDDHHYLREALLESFQAYVSARGSMELTELIRKAIKPPLDGGHEMLDEVLLPFARLYVKRAGKAALCELLTSVTM
ncbi:probable serine/threonine-protein kinase mps1 [Selaginella moellendorffii]|nr:probable serine/threonine-protein kinase mps1 [Selaginella moellendorffii]|eukprot:XP_002961037.2 probable serine/threonine-protein kinase mps1 [Selaginella moellendorffii]